MRWCGNRRASHLLHLTWGLLYSLAGGVQFTAGIYFMMALPIFQLGSNIWTGAWVSQSYSVCLIFTTEGDQAKLFLYSNFCTLLCAEHVLWYRDGAPLLFRAAVS